MKAKSSLTAAICLSFAAAVPTAAADTVSGLVVDAKDKPVAGVQVATLWIWEDGAESLYK